MPKRKTKKKQNKAPKERNWLAIHAHNRKGGAMTNRKKEQSKRACRGKVSKS